ncbi:PI31 proteasome regulator N-terminal-domain-containing protein [Gilbertella persicaria]|uniref:PI31 proteasome regulator N-terminal-domain-containing protein n=1 Tax=Gilbertella persicaria TaxID=101096 RepID=UPI00221FEE45|nr:PI31 proteasome regulator N-terminal-domain-containing protein [Gilbertella persicaria]KAI8075482.1 PI31 proteasome regulator N-terminal-domain-containing protein [Gilbertella persicaria]
MSDNKTNALDPSAILHSTSQIASGFKNPYDAIAGAVHAIMLSVGFRFAGLGDDARQEGDGTRKVLPENWNENGLHVYAFRYSHPQSSLTFVVKTLKLGDKCVILGLGIGDNKTAMLDFLIEDYTSASFYPYESSSDKPLVHGFISSNRFEDFIKAYKLKILQKLIPGLQKPGYEEQEDNSNNAPSSGRFEPQRQQQRYPSRDQEDIYDVGGSDLRPLPDQGMHMPGGGGGMYVGPDHPIFGGRGGSSLDDPSGLFGGPQPLPRGSVPPGARFDPIGPFGGLPRRPTGGNRGRGGPHRNFAGEPDNDELRPPGYDDMFM